MPKPPAKRQHLGLGWRLTRGARGGHARGILRFWPVWERITRWWWRLQPIPDASHDLLWVRFTRYHGQPITLDGPVSIASGAHICELHVHNEALARLAEHATTWQLLRYFEEDLRALARWSTRPDFPRELGAFYGVSLLGRAAGRLGFTVRSRPRTLMARADRLFMTGLLILYHPQGVDRLLMGTTYGAYPEEIWLSRGQLIQRYGVAT